MVGAELFEDDGGRLRKGQNPAVQNCGPQPVMPRIVMNFAEYEHAAASEISMYSSLDVMPDVARRHIRWP